MGLIATNTIAQGGTRSTGLRWICLNGGEIYAARTRFKWPGQAAVVVSVVHVVKGRWDRARELDGRGVDEITAFLFHTGGHDDPVRLEANFDLSFVGSIVNGMGFTFDDTDTKGFASPLSEMGRLIEKDPRNGELVFPVHRRERDQHEPHPQPSPLCDQLWAGTFAAHPCWPVVASRGRRPAEDLATRRTRPDRLSRPGGRRLA